MDIKELPEMYTAVTAEHIRTLMQGGEPPGHWRDLDPATLRVGAFRAASEVGKGETPQMGTWVIMEKVAPAIGLIANENSSKE